MAVPVPPLRPIEPEDLEPHARSVLAQAAGEARNLAPDLSVSTMLAHGSRVRAIVDGSTDAQLVVVGRETSHGLERLLTGATTAGVASNADCPWSSCRATGARRATPRPAALWWSESAGRTRHRTC